MGVASCCLQMLEGGECCLGLSWATAAIAPSQALAGTWFSLLTTQLRGQHLLTQHSH